MNLIDATAHVKSQIMAPGGPFEIVDKQVTGQTFKVYANAPINLSQVVNDSRRTDDRNFLVYQEQRLTFKDFFEQVDSMATWMHAQKITQGDRVVIAMRNRPEWIIAFCAAALIGAVPAPLNSFGTGQELREAIAIIEPKLIVCDSTRWLRMNEKTPWSGKTILLNDLQVDVNEQADSTSFGAAISCVAVKLPMPQINETDPALVLFTSGASSKAKAVVSSHLAVCQSLFNIDYISAVSAMTSPKAVAKIMEKALVPTLLTAVPLFHVSGLHAQLFSALRAGRRLIFTHKWEVASAIELIKQEQVTQFNGAPSMVMQLLRDPDFHTPEVMKTFGGLGFGGSGLPTSLIDSALSSLDEHMIGVGFGMTETNGVCAAMAGELFRHKPKSSGLLSPIMETRICSPEGLVLANNELGEICMRGVCLMDGYLGNDAATSETLKSGWLHSGDIGYIDDDGFLYIVDRIKDVIIRSGENISTAEVESCLLEHPKVDEAAVFGIPDEETGESIVAAVCLLDNESLTEAELLNHVTQHLAKYKVPAHLHIVTSKLPRNPAGKLLKNELKKALYV